MCRHRQDNRQPPPMAQTGQPMPPPPGQAMPPGLPSEPPRLGLRELADAIFRMMKGIPELLWPMQVFSYREALEYFIEERPNDPRITKGAILRQSLSDGRMVIIEVFLDHHNMPVSAPYGRPYGRWLVVGMIDEELWRAFGRTNLILVE